jgi:integral membrane protein
MLSLIKTFKIIAFLEGISYLLLFSNMLFIKHNLPDLYKAFLYPIGMTHGILFMAYIVLAIIVGSRLKWNNKTLFFVLLASLIPFGTFFIGNKYLKTAL